MAVPTKNIKQVTVGSNTYDIVPTMLQNSGYKATLPTLTADGVIALQSEVALKNDTITVNDLR